MNGKHYRVLDSGQQKAGGVYLVTETLQSHLRMAQGFRTHFAGAGLLDQRFLHEPDMVILEFDVEVQASSPLEIEKTVILYHSRDHAIFQPLEAMQHRLASAGSFGQWLSSHQEAWRQLWDIADIRIHHCPDDQLMLRLHVFHLLQTTSPHRAELDAALSLLSDVRVIEQ